MKEFLLRYIIIGILSFLFILSCSDKNHSITYPHFEGNFEFQSFTVDSIVSGTSYTISPKLGDHGYLYSGSKNNYNCKFTLIDFTSFYALNAYPEVFANPDTVDSMMLKLYLSDESIIPIPEIFLTYLHSTNDSIFHEDETLYNKFDSSGFPDTIGLGVFQLSEEDTNSTVNSIELIIKDTANISELLSYSDDMSKCFLLSSTETSGLIKMYSSESKDIFGQPFSIPELYIYYTVIDSTDSSYVSSFSLPVLQDVTLINPPNIASNLLPQDSLYISGSIFHSILEFSLDPFLGLPEQFVIREDSYLYLETSFQDDSVTVIRAYPLSDSIDGSEHFSSVDEEYPVDKSIYMPTWFEDGKLKIGIQSYLQYALTQEIEHFGINLQGSINNDPFAIVSVVKPDSSHSIISIEYVSDQ